jgi:hypothetical protein
MNAHANVAELADAPDLGSGSRKGMGVRPSPFAPSFHSLRVADSLTAMHMARAVRAPCDGFASPIAGESPTPDRCMVSRYIAERTAPRDPADNMKTPPSDRRFPRSNGRRMLNNGLDDKSMAAGCPPGQRRSKRIRQRRNRWYAGLPACSKARGRFRARYGL